MAFLALWELEKDPYAFLQNTVDPQDHLAREIAFGTQRRLLTLDHIAKKLTSRGKLSLKPKERSLVRMAIYQHLFMEAIPSHAVVHETVELAKRYCHPSFVRFLNAALRRLVETKWEQSTDDLPLFYSYPPFFVSLLLQEYPEKQVKEMLDTLNVPPPVMARERFTHKMVPVTEKNREEIFQSPSFYIQSGTQASLIGQLAKKTPSSTRTILDLCAAPGGKVIAAQEHFPEACLWANDCSEKRILLLKENLHKYGISAEVTCLDAKNYPADALFDLVILDVPCSNTGVLHKRAEARWRLTSQNLEALQETQRALLQKGAELLNPGGVLWYMTCAILHAENEKMVEWAEAHLSLKCEERVKILPDQIGKDGGFAALLHKPQDAQG